MRLRLIVIIGLVFLCELLSAQQSLAAIYKYVNKNGVITFTDDLQSVPEEYRASAKIVSGEASRKSSGEQQDATAGSITRDTSSAFNRKTAEVSGASGSFGGKALVSVVVVVSSAILFVILGTFDGGNKKVVKVMRLVIIWGVSVYLLVAHAGDVVHVVNKVSGGIASVQQQSEKKGKKAAEAVKAWRDLMDPAGQSPAEGVGQETEKKD